MWHGANDLAEKDDGVKDGRRTFLKEFGVRTVKSLCFWGMITLLGFSVRKDVRKISGEKYVSGSSSNQSFSGLTEPEEQVSAAAGDLPAQTGDTPSAGKNALQGDVVPEENEADESRADAERKVAALTFDDGPHPVYTEKLLDGLEKRHVVATFFVVGKNIPGNEDLIQRMNQEGHLIGNHTYDHVKICDMSGDAACEQVEKTSGLVREITGQDTEFVRPPFGAWNKNMECSFVMIPVLWDVDPLDWTTRNTEVVVERVLDDVESGDIILLHDYYDSSVEAALRIVDALQARGYEFVTVDRLILE